MCGLHIAVNGHSNQAIYQFIQRHLELIWITKRLTSLDICALTMFRNFNYSNYNTDKEN